MTYLRSFIDNPEITATPITDVLVGDIATNSKIPTGATVSSINGTTITLNQNTNSTLAQNEVVIFSTTPSSTKALSSTQTYRYYLTLNNTTDLSVGQIVTHANIPVGTTIRQIVSSTIMLSSPSNNLISSGASITFSTIRTRKTVATAQTSVGASFVASSLNSSKINGNAAILNLDGNFTGTQTFSEGFRNLFGLRTGVRSETASTTITTSDSVLYYTGSGGVNINLPSSTPSNNLFVIIVNRSSGTLTLVAPSIGSGSINGANSNVSITTNTSIRLHHKGSNNWVTL